MGRQNARTTVSNIEYGLPALGIRVSWIETRLLA